MLHPEVRESLERDYATPIGYSPVYAAPPDTSQPVSPYRLPLTCLIALAGVGIGLVVAGKATWDAESRIHHAAQQARIEERQHNQKAVQKCIDKTFR